MTLLFNAAAFIGITIVLVLTYAGRGVIDTTTEQGRALLVGLHGMWAAAVVGLLRRFQSPLADNAALIAWIVWAVIVGWLLSLHVKRTH